MHITDSKTRWIAAALFLALWCVLYALYPELLRPEGKEAIFPIALPAFGLFCFCCAIFERKEPGKILSFVSWAALLIVCACAILYATDIHDDNYFWRVAARKPYAAVYGAGVVLGVWSFFYALTASASWALRLMAIVFALFGFVNYFVAYFRTDPFVPMDIVGARSALSVLPSYTFKLSPMLAESILIFAGVILVSFHRPQPILNLSAQRRARLFSLVFSAAFFAVTTMKWHMRHFALEPTLSQEFSIAENGALVNFLGNIPLSRISPPPEYSLAAVDEIAAKFESDVAVPATEEMPDVIIILGESWAELARRDAIETNVPVMPYLESFKDRKDAFFGKLKVSVRGGQTTCSEFELLAGTNLQLGMHTAPLIAHVAGPMPVIPAFFKQMGYRTVAMHNGDKWVWGRDKAVPFMGFDKFYTVPDMRGPGEKWVRENLADTELYNKALSELETKDDKPLFLYLITMQTHGGYDYAEYESPVKILKPEGSYELAKQYLGLMRQSDMDFAEFMKTLEKRRRPTILLAYGDHLPAVGWEYWAKALAATEHDTWDFSTFYIVWSNFSAPLDTFAAFPALSLNYLGAHFMRAAGMPLTGHQKFLRDCSVEMPAITPKGVYDRYGNFIPIDVAASLTAFKEHAILQYNLLKGGDSQRKDFFYLQPAPEQ